MRGGTIIAHLDIGKSSGGMTARAPARGRPSSPSDAKVGAYGRYEERPLHLPCVLRDFGTRTGQRRLRYHPNRQAALPLPDDGGGDVHNRHTHSPYHHL